MQRSVLLLPLFAVACVGPLRRPAHPQLTAKQIVDRSKAAIVRIETLFSGGRRAVGTGFVVGKDGRIVTNLHVIHGANEVEVVLLDGSAFPVARVVSADADRDLAVITIDAPDWLPTLTLGDSDSVSAGDPVIAIGNPLGVLDYTVSDGLISSVRPLSDRLTVLQISAPISEGSSGGPLFNAYGEVIGVATMIANRGQNLNFGVPSNYLHGMLDHEGESFADFAERARAADRFSVFGRIHRDVPQHALSILDGCSDESLVKAYEEIRDAIEVGAPLYNQGNHEACFRIYEGAATRLEVELECTGLRKALGDGLLRANTLESYTAKAWAMRDAFDGIHQIIAKKVDSP